MFKVLILGGISAISYLISFPILAIHYSNFLTFSWRFVLFTQIFFPIQKTRCCQSHQYSSCFQNRWIIKIVEKFFFHCQKQIARIFACILITDWSSQGIRKAACNFCCPSEPCCFPNHSILLLIHLLCPFLCPLSDAWNYCCLFYCAVTTVSP